MMTIYVEHKMDQNPNLRETNEGIISRIKAPSLLLLSKEDVLSLRPTDRDTYAKKVILELLDANKKGLTISEIEAVTGLNRSTITKHIKNLVAIREAYSITRGRLSIYYRNGVVEKTYDPKESFIDFTSYAFHRVINEEGNFIYIQEKQKDYYGVVKVKGGIMIKDEDFFVFLKELQNFAMEVSE